MHFVQVSFLLLTNGQPELLSGSLRRNLDPFEQHDDATLNAALHAAGLFSLQTETDEARFTLDSDISGGGNNLSVGQRQIIALARAMVRSSKLLILDEGKPFVSVAPARNNDDFFCSYIRNRYAFNSSNQRCTVICILDHKTDAIIQATLRNELGSDTTVLTIAHRLQTIMDADKIVCSDASYILVEVLTLFQMVLDSGRIVSFDLWYNGEHSFGSFQVEYDSPQELLSKPEGHFKALVDSSSDKMALYAAAEQGKKDLRNA